MAVTTWLMRLESFTPEIGTTASPTTSRPAGRFSTPFSAVATASGMAKGVPSRTTPRYWLKEVARAADPTVNSRIRSQPMIQASSSPMVA